MQSGGNSIEARKTGRRPLTLIWARKDGILNKVITKKMDRSGQIQELPSFRACIHGVW